MIKYARNVNRTLVLRPFYIGARLADSSKAKTEFHRLC